VSYDIASQQADWWSVHEFAVPRLHKAGDWPLVGTPAWCLLETRDPVKWAAILDAAQHWALRLQSCQEQICDAAKDVAQSTDWTALARQLRDRDDFYRARPWLDRRSNR
jgi:hypothetical protein